MRLPRRLTQAGWVKLRRFGGLSELPDSKRGTSGEILLALSVVEASEAKELHVKRRREARSLRNSCAARRLRTGQPSASPGLGLL